MESANFEESNITLGPPDGMTEDQVRSVFAWQGGLHLHGGGCKPCFVTRWKPTREELDELEKGGSIWLLTMGRVFHPVLLTTTKPGFPAEEKTT